MPAIGAADAVEDSHQLAHGADTVAAIICEPVMGAGGVIVPPPTYFPRLREICDRHGVLLIADEVITGFGRTGKWFALGHWGIEPDLMSFAKGITSGYLPLGGVMFSKRIHDGDRGRADGREIHARRDLFRASGLLRRRVSRTSTSSSGRAWSSAPGCRATGSGPGWRRWRRLPAVGEVRGIGMLAAIELVEDKGTKKPAIGLGAKVVAEAGKRGLIMRQRGAADGPPASGDSLCLAPPLMTPEATLDRIVQIVGESIQAAM